MIRNKLMAAWAIAVLAACGGGVPTDGAPQNSGGVMTVSALEAALPAISIDAEGDSTMFGLQTVDGQFIRSAMPVPALVQAILQAQFGQRVAVHGNGAS